VVAEMKSVIAPNHNGGTVCQIVLFKRFENAANLGVDKTDAGYSAA
jgi:hypothetical protein